MKALIVAAGDPPDAGLLKKSADECDFLIAADAGLSAFMDAGVVPHLAVGDMDSVPAAAIRWYETENGAILRTPAEKNDTDAFLALEEARKRGAAEIMLLGAGGGRTDHFLSNLMLLKWAAKHDIRLAIENGMERVELRDGDFAVRGGKGQTVSILPAGERARVTAQGLYYPLEELLLTDERPRGISNVFQGDEARIKTDAPVLIITIKNNR